MESSKLAERSGCSLARFIENVQSLSADAIVLRQDQVNVRLAGLRILPRDCILAL
jgi:hypothetical protein